MYREGVICQDCHEPHSLKVRGTGELHVRGLSFGPRSSTRLPITFILRSHPVRAVSSAICRRRTTWSSIPAATTVSGSRGRILTVKIGTPNACNQCHAGRPAEWAADAVAGWYGSGRSAEWHYGEALHAGRQGVPRAEAALVRLADDPAMPAIARATALSLLAGQAGQQSLPTIRRGLESGDPLIRAAALGTLEAVEPQSRLLLGSPLLSDGVRHVRLEAARVLASVSADLLTPVQQASLDGVLEEYRSAPARQCRSRRIPSQSGGDRSAAGGHR